MTLEDFLSSVAPEEVDNYSHIGYDELSAFPLTICHEPDANMECRSITEIFFDDGALWSKTFFKKGTKDNREILFSAKNSFYNSAGNACISKDRYDTAVTVEGVGVGVEYQSLDLERVTDEIGELYISEVWRTDIRESPLAECMLIYTPSSDTLRFAHLMKVRTDNPFESLARRENTFENPYRAIILSEDEAKEISIRLSLGKISSVNPNYFEERRVAEERARLEEEQKIQEQRNNEIAEYEQRQKEESDRRLILERQAAERFEIEFNAAISLFVSPASNSENLVDNFVGTWLGFQRAQELLINVERLSEDSVVVEYSIYNRGGFIERVDRGTAKGSIQGGKLVLDGFWTQMIYNPPLNNGALTSHGNATLLKVNAEGLVDTDFFKIPIRRAYEHILEERAIE